jgi:hypothetical protein
MVRALKKLIQLVGLLSFTGSLYAQGIELINVRDGTSGGGSNASGGRSGPALTGVLGGAAGVIAPGRGIQAPPPPVAASPLPSPVPPAPPVPAAPAVPASNTPIDLWPLVLPDNVTTNAAQLDVRKTIRDAIVAGRAQRKSKGETVEVFGPIRFPTTGQDRTDYNRGRAALAKTEENPGVVLPDWASVALDEVARTIQEFKRQGLR